MPYSDISSEIKVELAPMPAGEYDVTILSDVLEFTREKAYLATEVIFADEAGGEFWLEVDDSNRQFLGKVGILLNPTGCMQGWKVSRINSFRSRRSNSRPIIAEVGYGPMTDLPTSSTTWKWVPAIIEGAEDDIRLFNRSDA